MKFRNQQPASLIRFEIIPNISCIIYNLMISLESLIQYFIKLRYQNEKTDYDFNLNKIKIAFYFLQLSGYVFSQQEFKEIIYQQTDYLAQIAQSSSVSYVLVLMYDDQLTIFFYIIQTLLLLTILACFISKAFFDYNLLLGRNLDIIIYWLFCDFQWYYLSGYQEINIGMITCGDDSYTHAFSTYEEETCFTELPVIFTSVSLMNTGFLLIIGVIGAYCLRDVEFKQSQLIKKYTIFSVSIFVGHQLLVILCYWKIYTRSSLSVHLIYIALLVVNGVDCFYNLPFGFADEQAFFLNCVMVSFVFELLNGIWAFSDVDDAYFFFTLFLCVPIPMVFIETYYKIRFEKWLLSYIYSKNQVFLYDSLKFMYNLSQEKFFETHDRIKFIRYMNIHCSVCLDLKCPCCKKVSVFFTPTGKFCIKRLNDFTHYYFKASVDKFGDFETDLNQYEYICQGFISFVIHKRNNYILAYRFCQKIKSAYQAKQLTSSQTKYFSSYLNFIQNRAKEFITKQNLSQNKLNKSQFLIVRDIENFLKTQDKMNELLQAHLKCQAKLWTALLNNYIQSFAQLKHHVQAIFNLNSEIKKHLQSQQNSQSCSLYQSRYAYFIQAVTSEDFGAQFRSALRLGKIQDDSVGKKNLELDEYSFLNGNAISIIAWLSGDNQALPNFKQSPLINKFFGYPEGRHIQHFEQFMPSFIANSHQAMVENYLERGQSSRIYNPTDVFILNSSGFIERISIILMNTFWNINSFDYQMIAMLKKFYNIDSNQIDFSKKGYILVDHQFTIQGITQNIWQFIRLPGQSPNLLMLQFYGLYQVNELVPQFFFYLKRHKEASIFEDQHLICLKEKATLKTNFFQKHQKESLTPVHHNIQFKELVLEMTIYQRSLQNKEVGLTLYYEIEIEVERELDHQQLSPQQKPYQHETYNGVTPTMIKRGTMDTNAILETAIINPSLQLLSPKEVSKENKQLILHEVESSVNENRRGSSSLFQMIDSFVGVISSRRTPSSLKSLSKIFFLQLLLVIFVMVIELVMFELKKSVQSQCTTYSNADINFLDIYSELINGVRHLIYYRDFKGKIENSSLQFSNSSIEFDVVSGITLSWQHIRQSLKRFTEFHEAYMPQLMQDQYNQALEVNYISYNLSAILKQDVLDRATHYQIMYLIFYWAGITFSKSPLVFLSGANDTYQVQFTRSILLHNFQDISHYAESSLQDCQSYNHDVNNFIDTLVMSFTIVFYFVVLIQLGLNLTYLKRSYDHTKAYFKFYRLLNHEDYSEAMNQIEVVEGVIENQYCYFQPESFNQLIQIPLETIDNIKRQTLYDMPIMDQKKSQNMKQKRKFKKVQLNSHLNFAQDLLFMLIYFFILMVYIFGLQLYFNIVSSNIAPINQVALTGQAIRLNQITTSNNWGIFVTKRVFESYYMLNRNDSDFSYMSYNIKSDYSILKLINIDPDQIQLQVKELLDLDIAQVLVNKNLELDLVLNYEEQLILLNSDICQLSKCNMYEDILQARIFSEEFSQFFSAGLIKLLKKINQVYYENQNLLQANATYKEIFESYSRLQNELDYIIYILWGQDAIFYQLEQFSTLLSDISQRKLSYFTGSTEIIVIVIGFIVFLVLSFLTFYQYRRLRIKFFISKSSLSLIPMTILFKRNIPKHVKNIERKQSSV